MSAAHSQVIDITPHPAALPTGAARTMRPVAHENRSIGSLLIDQGHLTPEDAEKVLRLQKAQNLRFGEAALQLGLVTQEQIRHALADQFDYPYLPAGDHRLSPELVAAYQPHSPAVEQLRALRSQLMLRWFDPQQGRRTLAIVSPAAGEGRSHVAANLAVVFSQLGERTLLIDADLRAPRQHQLFKLGQGAGLADILAGRAGLEAVARIPRLLGLSVLPAGHPPPNPQELLGRPSFTALLESLAPDFDVVILDTPATAGCADAHTVASRAGAAVLLTRRHRTSLTRAAALARDLQQLGTAVVGSVLNDG